MEVVVVVFDSFPLLLQLEEQLFLEGHFLWENSIGLLHLRFVLLLVFLELSPHDAVPVIFDGVVRSPAYELSQDRPLASVELEEQEKQPLLLFRPGKLLDFRVQVVVPSFPALLSFSLSYVLCNHGPLSGSVLLNQ